MQVVNKYSQALIRNEVNMSGKKRWEKKQEDFEIFKRGIENEINISIIDIGNEVTT